jgi:hypothetical protein
MTKLAKSVVTTAQKPLKINLSELLEMYSGYRSIVPLHKTALASVRRSCCQQDGHAHAFADWLLKPSLRRGRQSESTSTLKCSGTSTRKLRLQLSAFLIRVALRLAKYGTPR